MKSWVIRTLSQDRGRSVTGNSEDDGGSMSKVSYNLPNWQTNALAEALHDHHQGKRSFISLEPKLPQCKTSSSDQVFGSFARPSLLIAEVPGLHPCAIESHELYLTTSDYEAALKKMSEEQYRAWNDYLNKPRSRALFYYELKKRKRVGAPVRLEHRVSKDSHMAPALLEAARLILRYAQVNEVAFLQAA